MNKYAVLARLMTISLLLSMQGRAEWTDFANGLFKLLPPSANQNCTLVGNIFACKGKMKAILGIEAEASAVTADKAKIMGGVEGDYDAEATWPVIGSNGIYPAGSLVELKMTYSISLAGDADVATGIGVAGNNIVGAGQLKLSQSIVSHGKKAECDVSGLGQGDANKKVASSWRTVAYWVGADLRQAMAGPPRITGIFTGTITSQTCPPSITTSTGQTSPKKPCSPWRVAPARFTSIPLDVIYDDTPSGPTPRISYENQFPSNLPSPTSTSTSTSTGSTPPSGG